MSKDQQKNTMLHPFSGVQCEVRELGPDDTIESGDVYRSTTAGMVDEKSGLGRWFEAGEVLAGNRVGQSPVHFLRLMPMADAKPRTTEEKPQRGFRGNRS